MFKVMLFHGFVLSVSRGAIKNLAVGAIGCVFCGCGIQRLRLNLCILSGGHAAIPTERPAVFNLNTDGLKL